MRKYGLDRNDEFHNNMGLPWEDRVPKICAYFNQERLIESKASRSCYYNDLLSTNKQCLMVFEYECKNNIDIFEFVLYHLKLNIELFFLTTSEVSSNYGG